MRRDVPVCTRIIRLRAQGCDGVRSFLPRKGPCGTFVSAERRCVPKSWALRRSTVEQCLRSRRTSACLDTPAVEQTEAYVLGWTGLSFSGTGTRLGISGQAVRQRVVRGEEILNRGNGRSDRPGQTTPKDRLRHELVTNDH
jgi:hypothetical protein